MHHLFISYSRQDRAFVEHLSSGLVEQGKTTWVDWQDIPATATFMDEIRHAIDAADSFLFVISPASCRSTMCRQELGHAAASHKRLIPLVYQSTPAADVPPEVAPINWIDFTAASTFDQALTRLTTAIDTDLEWVHAHTELLVRAREWEQLGRSRSALLRGLELTTAEQNLVDEAGKPPLVVPLQQEFVVASRRNTTRTLRTIVGAVSTALIVTAGLAVLAFWLSRLAETRRQLANEQRQRAEEQTKVAEAATVVANDQRHAADQQRQRAEEQTNVAEAATVVADEQRRAAEVQRNTAEDTARLMTADNLAATDPTSAALVLLELHDPIGRELAGLPAFRHVAEQPIASAVLRGHSGFVFSGAFSPDGQHVATASGDQTARIWRTDGLGAPIVLSGHGGSVMSVSFNADGRRVITTSGDTARIWSADGTGTAVVLSSIRSAKFSPDGSRVITISGDKSARLYSLEGALVSLVRPPDGGTTFRDATFAGGQLRVIATANNDALVLSGDQATAPVVLRGHTQAITAAQFSADGSRVMTASNDGTIRVWPSDDRGDPVILSGGSTNQATLSGDGSHVATSNGTSVFAWNVATGGPPIVRRMPEFILFLTLSFDGRRMATFADATNFHLARVWRTEGPDDSVLLAGHEGRVYSTTFSRDGTKILTTGTDGTGRVWPAAGSGEPLVLGDHDVTINDAEFDSGGTRVVTADDKVVRVWNLGADDPPMVFTGHTQAVETAAFSPDGRRVVSASDDGTARVWSLDDRTTPIVLEDHLGLVRWARFLATGNAVVTESADRAWRIWPLTAPATPRVFASDPGEAWLSLSPDGSRARAASASSCREVALDVHGPAAVISRLPQASCVFSSDGTRVATYSPNATTIEIWNAADGRALVTLQGQASNIISATFSPDARRFATASGDRVARVWQLNGSATPVVLRGHTDMVRSASFSPDVSLVLTSAEDGTARIWYADGHDAPLVLRLPADQKIVMYASFSPDGSRVLTRTYTLSHRPNDVRVFRVDIRALITYLRSSTTACLTPAVRARAFGEPADVAGSHFKACEAAKLGR